MKDEKEMIEKIREKIILANNPECKSYEEALEEESIQTCEGFYTTEIKNGQSIKMYHTNIKNLNEKGNYNQILGLALTLERVLVALKIANEKRLKSDINFLQEIAEYNELEDISQIEEWMFCNAYPCFPFIQFQTAFCEWTITTGSNRGIISWLPNKTLEEQSEVTIRDIYNILV